MNILFVRSRLKSTGRSITVGVLTYSSHSVDWQPIKS